LLLPAAAVDQILVVLGRQVGRQEAHRRHAQGALADHLKNDREPLGRSCRLDAVIGGRFGEAKDRAAVSEEGRETHGEVEAATIELGQVGDERRGGLALAPGEGLHGYYKSVVRELGWNVDLHRYSISYEAAWKDRLQTESCSVTISCYEY
jgi:hypothetical protein